jgi:hypothetical protein
MRHEPAAFSWKHDRQRSTEVYEQWAERVWSEQSANCAPEIAGERDYYLGFRDGFVDYVWAGGSGEPPPVPPRHLWNVMLRSPDGKRRADLWFDGYRHGARAARFGGFRELGTVRTSLVGYVRNSNGMEYSQYPHDMSGPGAPENIEPVPDHQILPEPNGSQAPPSFDVPELAPSAFAPPAPLEKTSAAPISTTQFVRPADKQPAALEALGLALLPTEQPATKPVSTAGTVGSRPLIRSSQATSPVGAANRQPSNDASSAATPEPRIPAPQPPATSTSNLGNHVPNAIEPIDHQPIREIALNPSSGNRRAIAASHSEPLAATRKRPPRAAQAETAYGTTNQRLNTASHSAVALPAETAIPSSPDAERVITAIHTETTTPTTVDPAIRLNAAGSKPGQSQNSAVKVVTLIEEPRRQSAVEAPLRPGTSQMSRVSVADHDQSVERIVIGGRLPANSAAGAERSKAANTTITIRPATNDAERLPTKSADPHGRRKTD